MNLHGIANSNEQKLGALRADRLPCQTFSKGRPADGGERFINQENGVRKAAQKYA
jgi:hypothetical protein